MTLLQRMVLTARGLIERGPHAGACVAVSEWGTLPLRDVQASVLLMEDTPINMA